MPHEDDAPLIFSDEDFERRYSPDASASPDAGSASPSNPAGQRGQPLASRIGRSRNRFMRTLIRRRLASSAVR
jgi:hypothetical protein